MKEKKLALAWLELAEGCLNLVTKHFCKINVFIIFGFLLVNFLDLEIINSLSVERSFFYSNFENEKVWDVFSVPDKIMFHNCGPREDIENLA